MIQNTSSLVGCLLRCGVLHCDLRLLLLLGQKLGGIVNQIASDAQSRGDKSLALTKQTLLTDLLDLRLVFVQHILLALIALPEREEDNALALRVELSSWLLDLREATVNGRQGAVAKAIGLLEVGRYVLVRCVEVWSKGLAKALVALRREIDGFLAVGIRLEGVDGIVDYGIRGEMMQEG